MKTYKGMEIMEVIDLMDEIVCSTSLVELAEESLEHNFREMVDYCPEMLEDMICFVADNNKSFLFIGVDDEECEIHVSMWAAMNDKISFKETLQYFNAMKNLYKDVARSVRIEADCRTTTSLPIINKIDGRRGINVVYRGPEENGFVPVSMICRIED